MTRVAQATSCLGMKDKRLKRILLVSLVLPAYKHRQPVGRFTHGVVRKRYQQSDDTSEHISLHGWSLKSTARGEREGAQAPFAWLIPCEKTR
jgi:hypothetical protein